MLPTAFAAIDARHDRQIPVHLGLDRLAQGRHQHPAHADLEPGGQGAGLAVPRDDGDLVILDWLPWSHTFGANHNFNMVLRNGGTLYIDGGKPAPDLFATSLANLRSVMPTVYFNVPRGFDMLIAALRER